jgi:hypothetical protein
LREFFSLVCVWKSFFVSGGGGAVVVVGRISDMQRSLLFFEAQATPFPTMKSCFGEQFRRSEMEIAELIWKASIQRFQHDSGDDDSVVVVDDDDVDDDVDYLPRLELRSHEKKACNLLFQETPVSERDLFFRASHIAL